MTDSNRGPDPDDAKSTVRNSQVEDESEPIEAEKVEADVLERDSGEPFAENDERSS